MILILSASFGDGHNTAAQSILEALQASPDAPKAARCDLFGETFPRLTGALQSAYQVAITQMPWAWRLAYDRLADPDLTSKDNPLLRSLRSALQRKLEELQPQAILSTYPLFATLLEPLRRSGSVPPLFTVITDSVSVHPSWTQAPSDFYGVADEETLQVLLRRGIERERIHVTGFPVSPAFTEPLVPPDRPSGGRSLLYLPSTSVRHVRETLEALQPLVEEGVKLTVPAGKHQPRLFHTLRPFLDRFREDQFEVIGWTNRMPQLLRSHDIIICKAGGAILHEVLAARTPAVIDYVVPGQEEGNAEMLLSHGCALRSHSGLETAECVRRLLKDDGSELSQLREPMVPPLSLPDAAQRAADVLLQRLASP